MQENNKETAETINNLSFYPRMIFIIRGFFISFFNSYYFNQIKTSLNFPKIKGKIREVLNINLYFFEVHPCLQ